MKCVRPDTARRRLVPAGRLVALVSVAACLGVGSSAAAAAESPTERLWRAYPLEQTATTSDAPTPVRAGRGAPARSRDDSAPWPAVVAVVAVGLALILLIGRRLRRTLAALAPYAAPAPEPERFFVADVEVADEAPPPRRRTRGPVCQVRWMTARHAARFCAVLVDEDGAEHRLAMSPPVDVPGAAPPPEPTLQAQRALRSVARELRDAGWRPLRAKGRDRGEPRWYARRFTLDPAPAQQERPSSEVAR